MKFVVEVRTKEGVVANFKNAEGVSELEALKTVDGVHQWSGSGDSYSASDGYTAKVIIHPDEKPVFGVESAAAPSKREVE